MKRKKESEDDDHLYVPRDRYDELLKIESDTHSLRCDQFDCSKLCLEQISFGNECTGRTTVYLNDQRECSSCSGKFCSKHAKKYNKIICNECVKNIQKND